MCSGDGHHRCVGPCLWCASFEGCDDSVPRRVNGPLGRCCKPSGMVNVRECVQNCLKGMNGEELSAGYIEGSVQWKTSGLSLP